MGPAARAWLPVVLFLSPLSCDQTPAVHAQTDFVMGTLAEIKVVSPDSKRAQAALAEAFAELARVESVSTSYSDSSDVARLNSEAGRAAVSVGEDVDHVLRAALGIAQRTEAAFDPTAGTLVELWGFLDTPARPESTAVAAARSKGTFEDLVEEGARRWRLVPSGLKVDLGGIAKGYGVDRAAALLSERFSGCIVNAGGDLAVRGLRPDGKGWLIGVQDPRDPAQLFVKLRLENDEAVATSGDYQRFFEEDGVRYHHLLDPRTGWPAREVRSATVIAPNCLLADAWATAAFVLGPQEGLARLEREPDLEGVLVTVDEANELVWHATSGFARYVVP